MPHSGISTHPNVISSAPYKPFAYIGSLTYLAALSPTVVLGMGIVLIFSHLPQFLHRFDHTQNSDQRLLALYVLSALFLGNLAIMPRLPNTTFGASCRTGCRFPRW